MRTLDLLGIPSLPVRAFQPTFGVIRPAGGGKGDAPDAPDYAAAARATAAGNAAAAAGATQANRANQVTPWGTSTWTQNRSASELADLDAQIAQNQSVLNTNYGWGDAARAPYLAEIQRLQAIKNNSGWQQTISLSPDQQALFDQQNKLQMGLFDAQNAAADRVNAAMGQGFDMSQLPSAGQVYDPTLATNNAADLIMQRMNPDLDRQQEALRAQLANQGITQGSAAYNTAMGQFGQQRNDALAQAQLQGIGLGMQQQGMQFGQSQQARQQAMSEQAFLRNLPLNELNALRTGNQVSMPQFPGFAQQATTGGPDMLGAANAGYQAQLGAYNAQQAGNSGMMGGLLGLGSLGLQAYGAGLFGGGGGLPATASWALPRI